MSFQPEIEIALHALTAALVVWGGLQDWSKREVADWLTWPLFVMGFGSAIFRAVRLDFLPLTISIFVLERLVLQLAGWRGCPGPDRLMGVVAPGWAAGHDLHGRMGLGAGPAQARERTHPRPGHGSYRYRNPINHRNGQVTVGLSSSHF